VKVQVPRLCGVDPVCTVTFAVNVAEEVDPLMPLNAVIQKIPDSPPSPGPTVTLFELEPTAHVSLPTVVPPAVSVTTERNP
jgi:hypothetical protein